jgi:hypothetical protein
MTLDPLYIGPAAYDAVLFDLDGVLTPTAARDSPPPRSWWMMGA